MQTIKPVSEPRGKVVFDWKPRANFRIHVTTLILLGFLGLAGSIALSWLLGNSHVTELFVQLHLIEENPPRWLRPPQLGSKYYLLAPTLILFLLAQGIMKLSPQPRSWSRKLVAGILLILIARYLLWRSLSTLNLINPVEGIFSITLLAMEILAMAAGTIQLVLMFWVKDRDREARQYRLAAKKNNYQPTVDILIPTYNEPDFILKRTIVGCQSLDYQNKQIYLLDDTRRSEIEKLARELGCNYITRRDNAHAKAGNLNNALSKTNGELIALFDADFVPTTNFLEQTVGFFQNPKIGLVQTPQSFYNSDPIAKNLGLEQILTPEEEVFYRQMQPIKDGVGSVVCSGTSFVVRRKALEEIGGFVTESVSEDYFTGINISAKGYELVFLDEKLSAGLAAESITAHIDQRLRWGRGTLQAFFIESNPLTIPGLNLLQRLGHLEGLLHWFTCISRLFFLFVPLIYIIGLTPVKTDLSEIAYVFLPYYLTQLTVFSWLNLRSRSALLSDLYSLVQTFPVAVTVIKVMFRPFAKGFKVTPKGLSRDKYNFNWHLAFPMLVLLAATSFCFTLSATAPVKGTINLGLIWSTYNLITVSAAILTLIDIPQPSFYEWFNTNQEVKIVSSDRVYWGKAQKLSEEGIEILIEPPAHLASKLNVELAAVGLNFSGYITRSYLHNESLTLRVKFSELSLEQHRQLIQMLYCRPGQWRRMQSPSELQSMVILVKLLLRPLTIIFKRNKQIRAIA
jgi:cellulose synthase (UDP-forming)